jgi:hypothetical protein|tara:strand:- start:1197 stop:3251 length:2055 start_codon:yes stop_codon:yes gene_type:complete
MATNKHIIDIQTKGATKSKREIQGITGSLGKMATRAAAAAAAFYAAKGLIQGMTDLAKQASQVQRLERGFDNLGKQIGFNAASFSKLDKAVDGTMKQVDLMTKANNAMMLGVVKSDDEMAQLFDTAQRLGQALGVDTAQAIDSIVTGMGRQSKLMLDNLGIMIDTNKAYEDYAIILGKSASALTESEKKTAFNNAVLAESQRLVSALGPEVIDNSMAFEQLATSLNTAANEIGTFLSPAVVTVSGYFKTAADTVAEFFGSLNESDADSVIEKLSELGGFDETIQSLKKIELQKQLKDINEQISEQGIRFETSAEAINAINKASQGSMSVGETITRDLTEREDKMNKLLLLQNAINNLKDQEFDNEGKISILNEASGKTRRFTYDELIKAEENYRGQLTMREGQRISELQLEKELLDFKQQGLVFGDDILANADAEFNKNVQKVEKIQEELDLLLQKEEIEKRIREGEAEIGGQNEDELTAKDLFIEKLGQELTLKQQQIEWTDEFIEKNKELARSMGLVNSTTAEREKLARQDVANLQMVGAEFKQFSGVAKAAAIAQTTYDTYKSASSLFRKYSEQYPPPTGEILGGISAALAVGAGLARVQQIRKAQYGADFVTDGPQMMMVGEGSGPERVQVTPLQDPNIDGPQAQGMTINIQGSVIGTEEFTENTLLPQIREGIRLGEQI